MEVCGDEPLHQGQSFTLSLLPADNIAPLRYPAVLDSPTIMCCPRMISGLDVFIDFFQFEKQLRYEAVHVIIECFDPADFHSFYIKGY